MARSRLPAPLRWLGWTIVGVIALVALLVIVPTLAIHWNARSGEPYTAGEATPQRRADESLASDAAAQRAGRAAAMHADTPQILFGDLHVHTQFSADAALQQLRVREREAAHPPADACDFARFCSAVDFWSINDHAESLSPSLWRETVDAVRACNAIAGEGPSPDLVTFLGWEWSHSGLTPEKHYGHKNVLLLGTEDHEIPTRPIASRGGGPIPFSVMGVLGSLADARRFGDWSTFHRYMLDTHAIDDCPDDVPVRELPADCREVATTPTALFAKLDDWDLPAIVIPHGLSWGITNPAGSSFEHQITAHDPRWQRLLEVYSGHGNSEVFRDFVRPTEVEGGRMTCPEPSDGVTLCCQRARELARQRCDDPQSDTCARQMDEAEQRSASRSRFLPVAGAVPGTTTADWGDCDQLTDAFLPAYDYRPRTSAQSGFALGSAQGEAVPNRLRMGLIAASDNHRSRAGTGYKELGRQAMTDGVSYPIIGDYEDGRGSSFYYTGGLAAVHARARTREAIFEALEARHVYATSGDRMLLWFDLLDETGTRHPMGSEVALTASTPRFEVTAVGAFEQKPGCPPDVHARLAPDRIQSLCLGECYWPGDRRRRVTRIEVVRIQPQRSPDEAIADRIEDPWRSLPCPDEGDACRVTFLDEDFAAAGRETLYYVRAIQEPSPAVNGDPLRCTRDASGRCARSNPCGLRPDGTPEDCLAPVEERAWSSPIFVDPAP